MIKSKRISIVRFKRGVKIKSLILLLFVCSAIQTVNGQQVLSTLQRAWLYRIATKTPLLKKNMGNCFEFDGAPFVNLNMLGHAHADFDSILDYQLSHPESLHIYYDSIKALSPGLVSELTTKLTLWELNEDLKRCIYQPDSCSESIITSFVTPLNKSLPERLKRKKRDAAIGIVINPSLPIFKKIELLDDVMKSDITHQKKLFNLWRKLVAEYSFKRSVYYFNQLAPGYVLDRSLFLAAGEGSGTAGLLYEGEINPDDSTNIYWYGKGIGLFSYDVSAHKGELFPKEQTEGELKLLKKRSSSLHISLWGLDSSFKPLIVVTVNNHSYQLFARYEGKELSPDGTLGNGLSYVDRINQYKKLKVDNKYKELDSESPLVLSLKKENVMKRECEDKLSLLEQEIDSLREEPGSSQSAIDSRKRKIDSQLTILQKKRSRISYLENKLAEEYSAIAKAEAKVSRMQQLLGPNVQSWKREDSLYIFEDSVVFNSQTQDLIFPPEFENSVATTRLIAASYTPTGKNKDEVQLSVNLTNALPQFRQHEKVRVKQIDTVSYQFYYFPDSIHSFSQVYDSVRTQFLELINLAQRENREVVIKIVSPPDSACNLVKERVKAYPDRQKEFELPITSMGERRKSFVNAGFKGDTLYITAYGMTDDVPTRLSAVDALVRRELVISGYSVQNNKFLAVLRALDAVFSILKGVEPKFQNEWLTGIGCEIDISPKQMGVLLGEMFVK